VQPQLVLLQKTLLNIEGLGRQLYPDLDVWATGKPFLQRWVVKNNNPRTVIKRFVDQAPMLLKAMPEMPMLIHEYLKLQNHATKFAASGTGKQPMPVQHVQMQRSAYSLRRSITGASLFIVAGLLGSAALISGQSTAPWWVWLLGLCGLGFLVVGLRRK